jgi:hypothetical protein
MRKGNITVACEHCGTEFLAWKSANRRYCSTICSGKNNPRTHGKSRTRLYVIWRGMKNRCASASSYVYRYYGGRGISVCDEWRNDFSAFESWAIGNGYEDSLELDRRDVNGNYEPSNCRWANRCQQMRNVRKRRNATTSRFKGVSKHSQNRSWVAQLHAKGTTVNAGSYKTPLAAALAYDEAARAMYGDFAFVNFPERCNRKEVSHVSPNA